MSLPGLYSHIVVEEVNVTHIEIFTLLTLYKSGCGGDSTQVVEHSAALWAARDRVIWVGGIGELRDNVQINGKSFVMISTADECAMRKISECSYTWNFCWQNP